MTIRHRSTTASNQRRSHNGQSASTTTPRMRRRALAKSKQLRTEKAVINKIRFYERNFFPMLTQLAEYTLIGILIVVGVYFLAANEYIRIPIGEAEVRLVFEWLPEIEEPVYTQKTAPAASTIIATLPQATSGRFYWDNKPTNLVVLKWEEIPLQDQAWCDWMAAGVTYTNYSGKPAVTRPSREVCLNALTVEGMGGTFASLLIPVKVTESGDNSNPNALSYAGAGGQVQFMPETWTSYKPWPNASITELLDSMLGATNLLRTTGTENALLQANSVDNPRTNFVQKFSCYPRFAGCIVWNFGSDNPNVPDGDDQAKVIWQLFWKLQIARQSLWK